MEPIAGAIDRDLMLGLLAISVALNLLLLILAVAVKRRARRQRAGRRGRKHRRGLIPLMTVYERFPAFERSSIGPLASTTVLHIANDQTPGGISDYESWILCNLVGEADRIFEFGTATGKTTYLLAANSPPSARVSSLTLPSAAIDEYQHTAADTDADRADALGASGFEAFVYTGTPLEDKIEQLYGDSKAFSGDRYLGSMDLVFVDGSHARSYVEHDSRTAIAMARPGGLVIWHDYRGPDLNVGVYETLNDLAAEHELTQIRRTSMVVYQKP